MLTIRKAADRGRTRIGWLDSQHSFSFGDYHDSDHEHFGSLRVINEDRVAGGGGFPPHQHRDMEIVTYVLSGALAHEDSSGGKGILRPGEIQKMSAGTGITHSEFNASGEEPVHFLQIWIVPAENNLKPSYEQKAIDPKLIHNRFGRIGAPDARHSEVRIVQDVHIWSAKLDAGARAAHHIDVARNVWLQVARGEIELDGQVLKQGDGAAITDVSQLAVHAKAPSEMLLFEMA